MITREEYNKALDIIEAYHKQLFTGILTPSKLIRLEPTTDETLLKVGDKVICLAKNGNNKHLTVGKKYTIIQNKLGDRPIIKNDQGKKYSLRLEKNEWSKASQV